MASLPSTTMDSELTTSVPSVVDHLAITAFFTLSTGSMAPMTTIDVPVAGSQKPADLSDGMKPGGGSMVTVVPGTTVRWADSAEGAQTPASAAARRMRRTREDACTGGFLGAVQPAGLRATKTSYVPGSSSEWSKGTAVGLNPAS